MVDDQIRAGFQLSGGGGEKLVIVGIEDREPSRRRAVVMDGAKKSRLADAGLALGDEPFRPAAGVQDLVRGVPPQRAGSGHSG